MMKVKGVLGGNDFLAGFSGTSSEVVATCYSWFSHKLLAFVRAVMVSTS
jgi:prenyltransferase beta subunit